MNAMLALVFAAFMASASATGSPAWLSNVAISNLASIGEIAFLTQTPTGSSLYLMKGLNSAGYLACIKAGEFVCSFPPVASQNFELGPGYADIPPNPFTIKINGKYVQKTGSVLSIKSTTSPTQWTVDTYGRLCSGSPAKCLDVSSIALKTKVVLTDFSASSNTQQWVVFPSTNPSPIETLSQPSSFYGQIQLNDPATPGLCLQASATFPNGTVVYQPSGVFSASLLPSVGLRTCDASVPDQMVQSMPGIFPGYDGLGDYPTGVFVLNFASTNTCLTASIPQAVAGTAQGTFSGRFGVVIDLKDCVNLGNPDTADVSWGIFTINTRGQIQSQLYINGTLPGNDGAGELPLCLSHGGVAASINKNVIDDMVFSDCSHYRYTNRWSFIPQPPPATKQPSSGLVYPSK